MQDLIMNITNTTLTTIRKCCPSCKCISFTSLCKVNYSDVGINKYLCTHYAGKASNIDLNELNFELVQCKKCNLTYQTHVPNEKLLTEIYDVWIPKSTNEERLIGHDLNYYRYLTEQVQFAIQSFDLSPHKIKVLDFGFGWAEFAKIAMAFGCEVSGSELSKERIEYAQSIGLKCVNIENLPNKYFHYINTEQVFEHLVDPVDILAKLVNALRDDGILKISVPNADNSIKLIKKNKTFSSLSLNEIMPIAPLEHINCFNYKSLVLLADKVGLKPICPSFKKIYNSSSGWFDMKNAIRLLIRPIYRHILPKSTFVYFSLKNENSTP